MSTKAGHEWFVMDTGLGKPAFNMALDETLLESSPELDAPVLRFYGWTEPAATFGYFQNHGEVEVWTRLRPLIRRPTAGGIVPHDADWTYSLVFPAGHLWYSLRAIQSYRSAHEWVRDAFSLLGVQTVLAPEALKALPGRCFEGYEEADLLCENRKIAGAAQRRTKSGLLIQGSVRPPEVVVKIRPDWQRAMCEVMESRWGKPDVLDLAPQMRQRADALVEAKYGRESYNCKR